MRKNPGNKRVDRKFSSHEQDFRCLKFAGINKREEIIPEQENAVSDQYSIETK
jgi:hypothetical protein